MGFPIRAISPNEFIFSKLRTMGGTVGAFIFKTVRMCERPHPILAPSLIITTYIFLPFVLGALKVDFYRVSIN